MSIAEVVKELNEPVNKLLVPIASSAGQTLQDAWEFVFGSFGTYVDKKRLTRAKNIEDFKKSLVDKVVEIPEEHIQEPLLEIVGPALEASKYYFEEEKLREMFANLISAALDDRMNTDLHPSFTEIIKQMSPLDAQNLSLIDGNAPVARYRALAPDNSYQVLRTNVFLDNPDVNDPLLQSVSISSLSRLGLVSVSYAFELSTDYSPFQALPLFDELQANIEKNLPEYHLEIQRGVVEITPLGDAFKRVCLR